MKYPPARVLAEVKIRSASQLSNILLQQPPPICEFLLEEIRLNLPPPIKLLSVLLFTAKVLFPGKSRLLHPPPIEEWSESKIQFIVPPPILEPIDPWHIKLAFPPNIEELVLPDM